ncbi:MAG: hypothetical protein ACLPOO_16725 [Terriglobales bacterium]
MITALLVLILLTLIYIAWELRSVRRRASSVDQFLMWAGIGFLETRDLTPEQRENLQAVKEGLVRDGKFSKEEADFLDRA